MVGAALKQFPSTSKKMEEVIPQGIAHTKERVKLVQPN
jgi:hypothetical protein